jgi:hypothetical protein
MVEGSYFGRIHGVWARPNHGWFTWQSKSKTIDSLNTNVFAVSRLVFRETAAVFYGSNNFRVYSSSSFEAFLRTIGSHRSHLRYMAVTSRVQEWRWTATFNAGKLLSDAIELRRLELHGPIIHYLTQGLLPVLEMLHQYGKSADEICEILCPDPKPCDHQKKDTTTESSILCTRCSEEMTDCENNRATWRARLATYLEKKAKDDYELAEKEKNRKAIAARQVKMVKRRETGRPKRSTGKDTAFSYAED